MIDHNHFICHFIFGGHLLNIPKKTRKTSPARKGLSIYLLLINR